MNGKSKNIWFSDFHPGPLQYYLLLHHYFATFIMDMQSWDMHTKEARDEGVRPFEDYVWQNTRSSNGRPAEGEK